MNFKIPIAGLLIGLLVACSETKHDPTVPSTPKQQQVRQSKPEINQPSETGAKKTTNPFDRASLRAVNPTDDVKPKGAKIASKDSVIKAAKLTSEQAAQLSSIVGEGKDFKTQDVVVLPTDVPDGFKVAHFAAWKQTVANSPEFTGGHYEVLYENSRGACFTINGGVIQPIGDQPTQYERVLSLLSPALGSVDVGITGFDRASTKSFLGFTQSMNRITRGRNEYLFESPPGSIQDGKGYQGISGCSRIDEKDAIRIVQSLQFLNP